MALVAPDVSEFQTALTAAYPRDTLIFRACDGSSHEDTKFLTNASEVAALYKAGRLHCGIAYQVYRPVSITDQYAFFWKLIGPTRPAWLKAVMLDVESWGSEIKGDHSAAINQLAGMHAAKMGWNGVIGYGNKGDLAGLWPKRDARIRVIVAAYTSSYTYTSVKGAIGQQYTDGSTKYPVPPGLPRSTVPFGACDHNVFPAYANGAALAALLQPTVAPPKPPTPAPAPGKYPATLPVAIRSSQQEYALFMGDDGRIQVHHEGKYIRSV